MYRICKALWSCFEAIWLFVWSMVDSLWIIQKKKQSYIFAIKSSLLMNAFCWINHSLILLALAAGVSCGRVPVAIIAVPAILPILAQLAGVSLRGIPVTILAAPIAFAVVTFTGVSLGVVEVAIVALPSVLSVAAFAGVSFGGVPPVWGIVSGSAAFHAVAFGVADVAGVADPVVLPVLAGAAGVACLDVLFTVLAGPGHGYILVLSKNYHLQGFKITWCRSWKNILFWWKRWVWTIW